MGSCSLARELRLNNSANAAPQFAKVIPFPMKRPLEAPKAGPSLSAHVISIHEARIIHMNPPEHKKELKDKGHHRKEDALLSDAWKLSWVHWACYIDVFSKGGLRVSDDYRRVQYHQRIPTGTR